MKTPLQYKGFHHLLERLKSIPSSTQGVLDFINIIEDKYGLDFEDLTLQEAMDASVEKLNEESKRALGVEIAKIKKG